MLLRPINKAAPAAPGEAAANPPGRSLRSAVVLAIAAPVIAELISSSAPPLSFFVPWIFALFVLFYGGSALLIRELTLRWGKGWKSILLLGGGFGIVLEGISTRAFFDPLWSSLGPMVNHGRWLGVNWIWSVDAIVYHAVFSTALPILLVYQIFPMSSRTPWLSARQLWIAAFLFAMGAAVFIDSGKTRYPAPLTGLWACVGIVSVLFVLARFLPVARTAPRLRPEAKPLNFALLGFSATLCMVVQIYVIPAAAHSPALTAAVLAAIILIPAILLNYWTDAGANWNRMHQSALLAGALGCFGLMGFFQEVNPSRTHDTSGASLIGLLALIGLYGMWKRARVAALAVVPLHMESAASTSSGSISRMSSEFVPMSGYEASPSRTRDLDTTEAHRTPLLWRAFEVAVAATALLLTWPITLLLAVLIRLGTPGKALFKQQRIGINEQPFTFVKLRTLYADARERYPELYAYQYTREELTNLKFKRAKDPRVTPQGAWMRRSTLDELPNFWNVLTGDMALVGPRPEIPEMLQYYTGEMRLKFSVRPGVTGLAQISGRGRLGFYETAELDVQYVRTRSLRLDLKILVMTIYKMVTRDGAF